MVTRTLGILFLFTFGIIASPRPVPKGKVAKVLKSYAYATIRSTLLVNYKMGEEISKVSLPCQEPYSILPGSLPCNFWEENLTYVESVSTTVEGQNVDTIGIPEQNVLVRTAKTKSPNVGGTVLSLVDGNKELRLFYLPSGRLSHYQNGRLVVIFQWPSDPSAKAPHRGILVHVDVSLFPEEVEEFSF